MRPRLLSLTFVFAALLLWSKPLQAAHFCLEPDFMTAAVAAELIFSGKITKVERVEGSQLGEYVVTFRVDRWWKGTAASDARVLWRTKSIPDCPSLAVGEVGDEYLVYAERSTSTVNEYQLPEVTVSNRTAKLPPSRLAEMIVTNGFDKPALINRTPPLNRSDASNDVELLRAMRDCGCMPPRGSSESRLQEIAPECRSCLGKRVKPFFGFLF